MDAQTESLCLHPGSFARGSSIAAAAAVSGDCSISAGGRSSSYLLKLLASSRHNSTNGSTVGDAALHTACGDACEQQACDPLQHTSAVCRPGSHSAHLCTAEAAAACSSMCDASAAVAAIFAAPAVGTDDGSCDEGCPVQPVNTPVPPAANADTWLASLQDIEQAGTQLAVAASSQSGPTVISQPSTAAAIIPTEPAPGHAVIACAPAFSVQLQDNTTPGAPPAYPADKGSIEYQLRLQQVLSRLEDLEQQAAMCAGDAMPWHAAHCEGSSCTPCC